MSTPSGFFRGSRAVLAAAKSTAPRTTPPASAAAATKKTPAPAAKKPSGSGITKPLPVSPAMQSFVGSTEISRVDATKKIWEYIKLNKLQKNPDNKREIFCDDKLKTIFDGKDKVNFLEISKLMSAHFVKK